MILPQDIPTDLILQNENSMIINSEYGCHCDFLSKTENGDTVRIYPDIVIKYIEEVS